MSDNPVILACDTSTPICSVAVAVGGGVYTATEHSHRDHLKTLLPVIRSTCARANVTMRDVGLCVCSRGPGSFVGLRIALNTMKGFYAALKIPFVTVPTHEIYRHAYAAQRTPVIAAIQATKTMFYIATYYHGEEITPVKQMNITETIHTIHDMRAAYHTAPIITSVDPALLQHIERGIAQNAPSAGVFRVVPSSASLLCELGGATYKRTGMDAIDVNPHYVRVIDAYKGTG